MNLQLPSLGLSKLYAYVQSLLTNNPIYRNQDARLILFALGAGLALSQALSLVKGLYSLLHFNLDLPGRYGRGSWAVVTGASDGIGKNYAFELAKKGFNIVLISRNREKLEKVANEVKLKSPGTQTRIIVEDFINASQEGFAERIYDQVKDLDVSILVNNAGSFTSDYYTKISINDIRKMVVINCLSHALITRAFLPHMIARTKKSAIIMTSSLGAAVPNPYAQLYSSTKIFIDYLTQGLSYEYSNVDFLSMKPGGVRTKMGKKVNVLDIEKISPDTLARVALNQLGSTVSTYGNLKHRIIGWSSTVSPYWLVEANARRQFLK